MAHLDRAAHDDAKVSRTLPPPLVDTTSARLEKHRFEVRLPPRLPVSGGIPAGTSLPEAIREPIRVPQPEQTSGRIVQMRDLAREVVEVTIAPDEPMRVLPGQYCRFSFAGLPFRQFSPTSALGLIREDGYLRLHVKRVRGGCVTPHLGKTIKAGHRVEIVGPHGRAFACPAAQTRLVLIGSGTGFAPIWSIAAASLRETPSRPIVLAGAAATLAGFYMAPALEFARRHPNVSIVACVDEIVAPWHGFVPGPLTEHLPELSREDVVYAAGRHAMVGAIGKAAAMAGATFHADPFEPAPQSQGSWIESARRWLSPQ